MSSLGLAVTLLVLVLAGSSRASTSASFPLYEAPLVGRPYNVTYDARSLRIDDVPVLFLSGSLHLTRVPRAEWAASFQRMRDAGLNMVQTYVFWNFHEPTPGAACWDGPCDLVHFVRLAGKHGLFVNVRIGPYVCAEWNYGAIPEWLGFVDGIRFRTYNEPWLDAMSAFMFDVVERLKAAELFAGQGGPIVLAQIENELDPPKTRDEAKYVEWCGDLAAQLDIGVPWLMCNGASASNTINTCNGVDCTAFLEQHGQSGQILISMPPLWTEDEGGFQSWQEGPVGAYFAYGPQGFSAARWFARGGAHLNWYMWQGGNNFGHWAGSAITTMYAADTAVCPTGVPHEPKYSHVAHLNRLLAAYAHVIVTEPAGLNRSIALESYNNATHSWSVNGTLALAFSYGGESGLVFIECTATDTLLVRFANLVYSMPPQSVLVLGASESSSAPSFDVLWASFDAANVSHHNSISATQPLSSAVWSFWPEPLSGPLVDSAPALWHVSPVEQSSVSATLGTFGTPYLWYSVNVTLGDALAGHVRFLGEMASIYTLFVDGVRVAEAFNVDHADALPIPVELAVSLPAGTSALCILSTSLGFSNRVDPGTGRKFKGILADLVVLTDGFRLVDLTTLGWSMRPGLIGPQANSIWTPLGAGEQAALPCWYRVTFEAPVARHAVGSSTDRAWLLDATGLGRGDAYLNGQSLGLYWNVTRNDGSGLATQRYYYVPDSFLVAGTNELLLFETLAGQPATQLVGLAEHVREAGAPNPPVDPNVVSYCGF